MREIRCGIIGCGVIAPVHLEGYRRIPGVEVKTVCDLVPGKAEALAGKYGVPRACRDCREILDDPGIDCVSVCTDHASHAALVVDALEHGKHVVCEKCLTATPGQLDAVLAAHGRHPELVFSGIFQHRFEPANRLLRDMIREGRFGRLLTVSLNVACLRTPEYYRADAWRGTWAGEGGSVLINQSIHFFDLLRFFLGEIDSLCASWSNLAHQGVIETEDSIGVALDFRSGVHAVFCATSGCQASPWRDCFIFSGTEGYLEYSDARPVQGRFTDGRIDGSFRDDFARAHEPARVKAGKDYYGTGHPAQLHDVIDAIREGRKPFVTGEDAGMTARAVHACYESGRTGRWIRL